MLFTYSNLPILEKLENGRVGKVFVSEKEKPAFDYFRPYISESFQVCCPAFKTNIQKISTPFCDAMEAATPSLVKMGLDLYNVVIDAPDNTVGGTMLIQDRAMCYQFIVTPKGMVFCMFWFERNRLIGWGTKRVDFSDPGPPFIQAWVTRDLQLPMDRDGFKKDSLRFEGVLNDILIYLNFLKYANIETKVVGAHQKLKYYKGKSCNQTGLPVTIVDSTWFTTLIRTEGFGVRGHLRLQPCGAGLKDRRFVWINDYEKKGYTRQAKKILNDDN